MLHLHSNQTCSSVAFSPAEVLLTSKEHKNFHCGSRFGEESVGPCRPHFVLVIMKTLSSLCKGTFILFRWSGFTSATLTPTWCYRSLRITVVSVWGLWPFISTGGRWGCGAYSPHHASHKLMKGHSDRYHYYYISKQGSTLSGFMGFFYLLWFIWKSESLEQYKNVLQQWERCAE